MDELQGDSDYIAYDDANMELNENLINVAQILEDFKKIDGTTGVLRKEFERWQAKMNEKDCSYLRITCM